MLKKGRKTSVVWSFESDSYTDRVVEMIKSQEVDAIRLGVNPSDVKGYQEFLTKLKNRDALGDKTPVLVDLYSQPRATVFGLKPDGEEFSYGDIVTFYREKVEGKKSIVSSDWDSLYQDGSSVYFGYSEVVLKPVSFDNKSVELRVVQGGRVYEGMEVHVPATKRPIRIEDIPSESWGIAENPDIDCVILPSFQTADDLKPAIERIKEKEDHPWIFLKIGSVATYNNIDSLLPLVDGIIISRVELAMAMDPARIPIITKEVIAKSNKHATITLIASEMLRSMRYNATPTRAEVSDIGNAVFDGADGVILSEELPRGSHAERGLELAKKTIADVESSESEPPNWQKHDPEVKSEIEAITYAAYRAAYRNNAKAIVCLTKKGNTALHLASFDVATPIIAITVSKEVVRRLELIRGVEGSYLEEVPPIDEVLPLINNLLIRDSWLKAGDKYVFVSVTLSSVGREDSNLFTIQTVN